MRRRIDEFRVITYADYEEAELDGFAPRVVHVDAANAVLDVMAPRPVPV